MASRLFWDLHDADECPRPEVARSPEETLIEESVCVRREEKNERALGSERCPGDCTFAVDEDEAACFLAELVCTQKSDVHEGSTAMNMSLQRIRDIDNKDNEEDDEEDDHERDHKDEEDASMNTIDMKRKSSPLRPSESNGGCSKRLITDFFCRPDGRKVDLSYAAARQDAKAVSSRMQERDKNGRVTSGTGRRKAEGKENDGADSKRQHGERRAGVKWRGRFTSKPPASSEGWRKSSGPNEWQQVPGTSFLVVSGRQDVCTALLNFMDLLVCAHLACHLNYTCVMVTSLRTLELSRLLLCMQKWPLSMMKIVGSLSLTILLLHASPPSAHPPRMPSGTNQWTASTGSSHTSMPTVRGKGSSGRHYGGFMPSMSFKAFFSRDGSLSKAPLPHHPEPRDLILSLLSTPVLISSI